MSKLLMVLNILVAISVLTFAYIEGEEIINERVEGKIEEVATEVVKKVVDKAGIDSLKIQVQELREIVTDTTNTVSKKQITNLGLKIDQLLEKSAPSDPEDGGP